ncbi:hypothetical protein K438DRAFT_1754376 [Mycena galopus ATCC 62051]|nr:hypothetical protein K438DRAFT_1754376 [Mycena galopus ATCC 62051]
MASTHVHPKANSMKTPLFGTSENDSPSELGKPPMGILSRLVAAHANPLQVVVETAEQPPLNTPSLQANTVYTSSGATETAEPTCDDDGLESYEELENQSIAPDVRTFWKLQQETTRLLRQSQGPNCSQPKPGPILDFWLQVFLQVVESGVFVVGEKAGCDSRRDFGILASRPGQNHDKILVFERRPDKILDKNRVSGGGNFWKKNLLEAPK